MIISTDVQVLRDLAQRYAEIAHADIQDERRRLWRRHNSLQETRPLILVSYGMWNVWCWEKYQDSAMQCEDPFFRPFERFLRLQLLQHEIGDDTILEPWITLQATRAGSWGTLWGVPEALHYADTAGGAARFDPQINTWDDMDKLSVTPHLIDEASTRENYARLQDAVGDILPVNINYGCAYEGPMADISTSLARLRGLEQIMEDMYDAPEQLHRLLAFMRDGILATQHTAEEAGAYSLTTQMNQSMTYSEELEDPRPNSGPRHRRELWAHFAAQEYTLVSPAMHEAFMLEYQLPIMEEWGLIAYGCCEDLTKKIDLLRRVPNLRQIAVSPVADVAKCAEQIGTDYVFSWRPNPTDMVCCGFDEDKIRQSIRDGLQAARGCRVHLHLKDIETVEGDISRLPRWVAIVRDVIDECW